MVVSHLTRRKPPLIIDKCRETPSESTNKPYPTVVVAALEEEAADPNRAVNDLAESSFAGVTAQNDFLTRPTTKKISTHSCVNVCLIFFQQLKDINVCHFLHFL